jgi:hypothetical protein
MVLLKQRSEAIKYRGRPTNRRKSKEVSIETSFNYRYVEKEENLETDTAVAFFSKKR